MLRTKRIIAALMAVLMVLSLAACGSVRHNGPAEIKDAETAKAAESEKIIAAAEDPAKEEKSDYLYDTAKTYAVAVVKSKSEGGYSIGRCADGFTMQGKKAHLLDCEVLYYFNYDRLKEAAENDDPNAVYMYFKIGGFVYGGSKARTEELKDRPGGETIFDGNITEEFVENLKERGKSITYCIYLDMEHGDAVEVGDTILVAIDPQLTINPNYVTGAYEVRDPKSYFAVASPFAEDSPQPCIAKFVDGKLQLPAGLSEAITLRRLYDDTYPELTGIKDGDSVEDVVNFLKAVEQDMIRYEQELRQLPASTDVSSIR